ILTNAQTGQSVDAASSTLAIGSDAPHTLAWDSTARPIDDAIAYNDAPSLRGGAVFPAGDVRLRFNIKPETQGMEFSAIISARSQDFRFEVVAGRATLSMRQHSSDEAAWTTVAERPHDAPPAGAWSAVSFALVDQALVAEIDGRMLLKHELDWSPRERLMHATGRSAQEIDEILNNERDTSLAQPGLYRRAEARVRVEFSGAPATLGNVGLDRDVSYSPAERRSGPLAGEIGLAGHPLRSARLKRDQMFVLGDNAAASRDGRLWDTVNPRVAAEAGRDLGVVPTDLLIGRAFMVYFPTPHEVVVAGTRRPLVPDFGRVRLIR
ncbi:MAG: S26 family signal peptidase, partial [Phycisphaerales bacterium]